MDWKRFFMSACCLLVVCCLIINISPIKAEATTVAAAATVVALPSLTVIACCLIGLGIMAAVVTTDWEQVVNDCSDFLKDVGFVDDDGNINVYAITDGAFTYGVTQELVETVREWMFDSEVVTAEEVPEGFALYNGVLLPTFIYTTGNTVLLDTDVGYVFYHSATPLYVYSETDKLYLRCNNYWYKYTISDTDPNEWECTGNLADQSMVRIEGSTNKHIQWSNFDISYKVGGIYFYGSDVVYSSDGLTTSYDVTLGAVAGAGDSLAAGYAAWYAGALTFPGVDVGSDDEEVVVLPAGIGQTLGEMATYTQADVWAGVSTYEDTTTDTDTGVITGTFADTAIGTFINALVDALTSPLTWLGGFILDGIKAIFADTSVGSFIDTLTDALLSPLTWLGEFLLDGIKAIFVPSEDFLTDKVNALRENFGFADSIMTTFEMFTTSLFPNSTSPPVIYVDLSAASGSYYLGEKIVFIDMSFYAPYKATGDIMISAFLWLMFIWRVGIRLPGIIRGASGVVNFANAALVDKHFNS